MMTLDSLLDFFEAQAIDVWRMLSPFCKADPTSGGLPLPLKYHFYQLEVALLLQKVWATGSPIFDYIKKGKEKVLANPMTDSGEEQDMDFEEYDSAKSSDEGEPQEEVHPDHVEAATTCSKALR